MDKSLEKGPTTADLEELSILLENRTFVDYFNTFLCLPIFGQHVFYNFMEQEFEFEPPVRNRRHLYLDGKEVLRWLYKNRLQHFKKSALYTEYCLCMLLLDSKFELPDVNLENTGTFAKNIIGTVTGMALFRESMRGTCGENVFRCWKDLEAWKRIDDPIQKIYWKHVIKKQYICHSSTAEVAGNLKEKALYGILKFDLVPDKEIQQRLIDSVTDAEFHTMVESDAALLTLQTILLDALKIYWLPRHLLHTIKEVNKEIFDILKRPAPGDMESIEHVRRLRCQYKFPTIYQDSRMTTPETAVIVSRSAGDFSQMSSFSLFGEEEKTSKKRNIDPVDLLSLCGGPVKKIVPASNSPTYVGTDSPFLPEIISPENGSGDRQLPSANTNDVQLKSPVPMILSSYLGGKTRTMLGNLPETNWIVSCLASDMLACCPFRKYLQQNDQQRYLQYLGFWTDIRNYLDTDDHVLDGYGQPMRQQMTQRIIDMYLSEDGEGCNVLPKKLKRSLIHSLKSCNNVSTLFGAQEIVQELLLEPLQLYFQEDRHQFLQQIQGQRKRPDCKQHLVTNQMANTRPPSARKLMNAYPMLFFNCATIDVESELSSSLSPFSPTMPSNSATSRPPTTYHVSISEAQMWKAMELTVLCSEYGVSMMVPDSVPKPSKLVDVLFSDYGSLHVTRDPTVRNEWLKSLKEKPKINIETIKVSREVLLEEIDISTLKRDKDEEPGKFIGRGRAVRRTGFVLERPKKPKSLMEVLSTPVQYDFFKRYMIVNKMSLPVVFWRAVEDLQEISNSKTRQIKVKQIMRKFFGKYAKFGSGLDCDEEIIRQIPNMQKVTPGILICAQAAVFRSLERKWYPMYCASFPPDSECSSESSTNSYFGMMKGFGETAQFVTKTKKVKKRIVDSQKTMEMWMAYSKGLVEFVKAMNDRTETQLFAMFLKYEVEKEKQSSKRELASQLAPIERNIMMSALHSNVQTRVVVRNRLVIMNRLPTDLSFWTEIMKYQSLFDSALRKDKVSTRDYEFLTDKARSIVSCFLASEILPRVQVNIPNDMALNIVNSLASSGPKRGLFHDAVVLLFPTMYHFYRRFSNEWMKGNIPDEFFDNIEHVLRGNVGTSPHGTSRSDFRNLHMDQIKTSYHQSADDNTLKIHFSISEGVTMIYPQVKKSPAGHSTRMTKNSIHVLKPDSSIVKGSKGGRGDSKDSKLFFKEGDKAHAKSESARMRSSGSVKEKHKSEKIVVKVAEQISGDSSKVKDGSVDKARKLSVLVESLNKEKEAKIKEQNKMFSKLMTFSQVVSAAVATEITSDSSSSNHTISNIAE